MKLDFVIPQYQEQAKNLLLKIQNEMNIKIKNYITINKVKIVNYKSAIEASIYFGKVNYNNIKLKIIEKQKNRKLSTLFILLSTHMIDKPNIIYPKLKLCSNLY